MGSSAEIYIKHRSDAAEAELVRAFMEIVAPLGYDADAEGDHGETKAQKRKLILR